MEKPKWVSFNIFLYLYKIIFPKVLGSIYGAQMALKVGGVKSKPLEGNKKDPQASFESLEESGMKWND